MRGVDEPDAARLAEHQLADVADLVATGPVGMGAFTQAEMAVVLGDVPALAGVQGVVLAEAVRSLAARGVLHRVPGEASAEVVGDLGLMVALVATSVGTLDIRRGHEGPADAPWRWLISLFGASVVGVDRIDALGLHRLSLYSVGGIADVVADRLIAGRARIPADETAAVPITDARLRRVAAAAPARWQLIHRVPRRDSGTRLVVESMVLRTGEARVDLVTRIPEGEGYQRMAVDAASLRAYLRGLFTLR
jgi:hypothetical protein